jgi:hypothetical protein
MKLPYSALIEDDEQFLRSYQRFSLFSLRNFLVNLITELLNHPCKRGVRMIRCNPAVVMRGFYRKNRKFPENLFDRLLNKVH